MWVGKLSGRGKCPGGGEYVREDMTYIRVRLALVPHPTGSARLPSFSADGWRATHRYNNALLVVSGQTPTKCRLTVGVRSRT